MNYKLTENKKVFNGETLFQIKCIEDCKYAKVGELGGYVMAVTSNTLRRSGVSPGQGASAMVIIEPSMNDSIW